ncbi:tetratricopeptide repeat protein [Odoribacter sp. OttesenSCG-928-J03]|nr:tetratricopeptide repeat protein [Odoribacter sp. OttesenSCG-928-J03]MDL2283190.1 tetratricopeptide repeat protein [Odoribacter sp. OttesenSCG-928-G04]
MSKKKTQEDKFEHIEEALTRSEQFIEKNQKVLINSVIVILLIVVAILGYDRYIREPKKQEAASQLFGAQSYFEKDSLQLALNGDGNVAGFLEIADRYSSTPAGNLAKYYAGLCYLYLSDYNNAIQYLSKFSSDDFLVNNMAKANIGDAYMQLNDYKKAAEYYKKAASSNKNDFSTPVFLMKNALAYEKSNDYNAALKVYEQIKQDYPQSTEARDIEKYIERTRLFLKK